MLSPRDDTPCASPASVQQLVPGCRLLVQYKHAQFSPQVASTRGDGKPQGPPRCTTQPYRHRIGIQALCLLRLLPTEVFESSISKHPSQLESPKRACMMHLVVPYYLLIRTQLTNLLNPRETFLTASSLLYAQTLGSTTLSHHPPLDSRTARELEPLGFSPSPGHKHPSPSSTFASYESIDSSSIRGETTAAHVILSRPDAFRAWERNRSC